MNNIPEGATHESLHGGPARYYQRNGTWWNYWDRIGERWAESHNSPEFFEGLQELPKATGVAHALKGVAAGPSHDTVNNPKHYQLLPGVEVYDIRQALAAKATAAGATIDQFSDYDRAVEYLLRMWEKNGVEDAQKAAWYLNKLVEKLNGSGS